jgi:hypothetical protein
VLSLFCNCIGLYLLSDVDLLFVFWFMRKSRKAERLEFGVFLIVG